MEVDQQGEGFGVAPLSINPQSAVRSAMPQRRMTREMFHGFRLRARYNRLARLAPAPPAARGDLHEQ
jgi:hypothetical protein